LEFKMKTASFCVGLALCALAAQAADSGDGLRQFLAGRAARDAEIARSIWNWAEVGYQETKSSALLQQELTNAGFKVETGVAGIPTAFVASAGSGKPVIGILAEFDALPGINQDAVPDRKPIEGKLSGHACGHHLLVRRRPRRVSLSRRQEGGKSGTIRVYSTPARRVRERFTWCARVSSMTLFAMHWHPSNVNFAGVDRALANKSQIRFPASGVPQGAPRRALRARCGRGHGYMSN
jgi:aminobenzoyl-glutamate utilization protein B